MNIYQHFRKEEVQFIDKVLEISEWVQQNHCSKLIDFITPREQDIITSIVGQYPDLSVQFFGGPPAAERKRCLFIPEYFQVVEDDFSISALRLTYASKFATLTHQQVLGTLMSLGLVRGKFGDIYLQKGYVDLMVATEITSYVINHLFKIAHVTIKITPITIDEIKPTEEKWEIHHVFVSSLRVDALLSEATGLSRQKCQLLIEQERVQVNWRQIAQKAFELKAGDLLSIRGIGRIKIQEIEGKTKKDKWKLMIAKTEKKP